jgi:hypothetical protein
MRGRVIYLSIYLSIFLPSPATGGHIPYSIELIYESNGGFYSNERPFVWFSRPALNDREEVVFQGKLAGYIGCPYCGDEGIFKWNKNGYIPISTVGWSQNSTFFGPSINNEGQVAFSVWGAPSWNSPVLKWTNGETVRIAEGSAEGTYSVARNQPGINNNGEVVFHERGYSSGYRVYDKVLKGSEGSSPTMIAEVRWSGTGPFYEHLGEFPSINDNGDVVFTHDSVGGYNRSYLWKRGSVTEITPPGFNWSNAEAINNQGDIFFQGQKQSGEHGIYVRKEDDLHTTVDTSTASQFSGVSFRSANDRGDVTFGGSLKDNEGLGIFLSAHGDISPVVKLGDTVGGRSLTHIFNIGRNREELNNLGQVIFVGGLSDGTGGLFLASPPAFMMSYSKKSQELKLAFQKSLEDYKEANNRLMLWGYVTEFAANTFEVLERVLEAVDEAQYKIFSAKAAAALNGVWADHITNLLETNETLRKYEGIITGDVAKTIVNAILNQATPTLKAQLEMDLGSQFTGDVARALAEDFVNRFVGEEGELTKALVVALAGTAAEKLAKTGAVSLLVRGAFAGFAGKILLAESAAIFEVANHFAWQDYAEHLANIAQKELILQRDPPDNSYNEHVSPIFREVSLVTPGGAITQELANRFNAVLQKESLVYTYLEALSKVRDRYESALNAGNLSSAQMQAGDFASFRSLLGNTYGDLSLLYDELLNALLAGNIENFSFGTEDIIAFLEELSIFGFPDPINERLLAFGFTFQQIDEMLQEALTADFNFNVRDFFSGLGDSSLIHGNLAQSFAPVPEPSTLILLGSGLAGLLGWKRRCLPGKRRVLKGE